MTTTMRGFHPFVKVLLLGTLFTTLTYALSIPFLAIYLMNSTNLEIASIGLIVGAGPLAGTFSGFFGGFLSDKLGRKKLMIVSLLVLALSFVGMVLTSDVWLLLLLNVLRGISSSFFGTISKALMGDLTPEKDRYRMFSTRYMAMNVGFSLGPVIGAFLGAAGSLSAFWLTGATYFLYAILLVVLLKGYQTVDLSSEGISISSVITVIRKDSALLLFLFGGLLLTTVHGEMSVTLSQYLEINFTDGMKMFGTLMSVNGFTVILLQSLVTRRLERFTLFQRMAVGGLLFAAGEVGFAFSTDWAAFIVSMIVFTFGEICVIPAEYAHIDQISPSGLRGTYYGAQSFSELGNFLGPWAGGLVLANFGGKGNVSDFCGYLLYEFIFLLEGTANKQAEQA